MRMKRKENGGKAKTEAKREGKWEGRKGERKREEGDRGEGGRCGAGELYTRRRRSSEGGEVIQEID
ncbi:hypothetical protein E2C01_028597 [Portunus trituberculatus]|uniref:Uncharacterized protein n=1 Tax=Portunus trituberculatus TaxID=210409 RepID=A0A5B7EPV7_PORTR|nr:hypothetical protein [Portunus trituberculatus]